MKQMRGSWFMKAVVINQYGSKEVLEEAEVTLPELSEHQVLVKEYATSINPIDWKLREGYLKQMFDWSFPIILGWDVAGVITEVGSQVTDWQVGDKVFARPETTRFGTYAEVTIVDDHLLAKIPETISFEEAAAVPLAGLTAWQALFDHGHLKEGETVLIHAGAGGVGTYAIQLAKEAGAHVITTASAKNHALLKKIGADEVIDYHTTNFAEVLADVDLVFDTMGGEVQKNSFDVLKPNTGRLVSIVGIEDKQLAAKKNISAESIWLQPNGEQLQKIADLMAAGKVKSIIGEVFPFSRQGIYDAHALSETHHAVGKIVVQMAE
ncbi:NADP-dependent oxidoreductase [Enterococcus faecalis]|uniref:NADP-dependent oxidoreductase n=1 Tax=Enterococcus TaxID=1350 RepID=UPI001780A715|nr:NADP-dependent oxidoreductase [Enterococcus faecalis]MBD9907541.1 NADP-dependent oxidoreductase [Enterococcus faecalis]MBD9967561.1 NADP-dependent oxidoreductase [Enterococcus faecalis]MCH1671150.1 NADP-dependent oxidoreductase [Enterococcus faecalis]MDM3977813.1 NADP-dependent oxidoreductase [Enterococcus faecalis]MDW0336555.1 NADP-dependent oxidoreductase [Enterococcus faecalis]